MGRQKDGPKEKAMTDTVPQNDAPTGGEDRYARAAAAPEPPVGAGPLARREARLAWGMLFPTLFIVSLVVVLPLLAVFWISFKPVGLADLRPPEVVLREDLRGRPEAPGDAAEIRYRLRNSSQDSEIRGVTLRDEIPPGLELAGELDPRCTLENRALFCDLGDWEGGHRDTLEIPVTVSAAYLDGGNVAATAPVTTGRSENVLTNLEFTTENFARVFEGDEFWRTLGITLFYTFFGTIGAIVLGLFAAMLLNREFRGQGLLRGLFLFPYVAPIIAVAFTWVILFDPFSGSLNALMVQMEVLEAPINFFGQRPTALIMVTVFAMWSYFPLCFLFILARMQALPEDIYEAADMDGASPFQKFWYLSLPQLMGILSVLFLLRFIWTFNKFDDIFLLTGGNAGTRTLTVNVYEQAFAVSNIGAGAAVAVVIFGCLLLFSFLFFRYISREEGL
jgi:multiple sugar transport system permease protein